jgi:hypothetical protein
VTLLDRMIVNRAKKVMSDAGRALGAARIAKDRAQVASKTDQLRNCIASGRIAHMEWK